MTIQATTFEPKRSGIKALLDQLYDVKFSKHTPLVVVLLSMIYTVYRTRDYLARTFHLEDLIAWPTAVFIELLILAASAGVFIALRAAFVAELRQRDQGRSRVGVAIALLLLASAFVALLIVAWADAYALTHDAAPALVMTLIQFSQMLLVCLFIMFADGEERELLRQQYADYAVATAQTQAAKCPYCHRAVAPNNRARHIAICPMRQREVS